MRNNKASLGSTLATGFVIILLVLLFFYLCTFVFNAVIRSTDFDSFLDEFFKQFYDEHTLKTVKKPLPSVTQPRYVKMLKQCTIETLQMLGYTALFGTLMGLFFGVILVVTQKDGIMENSSVYQLIDKTINIFRSIPFIILMVFLLPVTNKVMGTMRGVKGAMFPLLVATVPFFSRQIHAALCEVDGGMIEAARSMGLSSFSLILRVYLREGLPGMIRAATITFVNIIALSAMAGTVGGGGLGNFAYSVGYQQNCPDITLVTIALILILVTLIQTLGTLLERLFSHH